MANWRNDLKAVNEHFGGESTGKTFVSYGGTRASIVIQKLG